MAELIALETLAPMAIALQYKPESRKFAVGLPYVVVTGTLQLPDAKDHATLCARCGYCIGKVFDGWYSPKDNAMPDSIGKILSEATFYSDEIDYSLIRLPTQAITAAATIIAEIGEPFGALLVDKDEVTLLTRTEAVAAFSTRLRDATVYPTTVRLITIDVELDPTLTGFIAQIGRAMADAGIGILPYAAYTRDHLLVPADKVETAIAVLESLKSLDAN